MSPLSPEYAILLASIERLTYCLGQIEVDLAHLQRRETLLKARVDALSRQVAQSQSHEVLSSVLTMDPPGVATVSPSFTRIVAPATVTPVAADLVDTVQPESAPIWTRVPERYRRAAWIGAPIVVVMVVSTWMASADSGDPEPTPPVFSEVGISRTATARIQATQPFVIVSPSTSMPRPSIVPSVAGSSTTAATPSRQSATTPTASIPSNTVVTPADGPTSTVARTEATTTGQPTPNIVPSSPIVEETPTLLPTATSTETPAPATVVAPGEIVPGGVGSTETMVVETFGQADGEQDGRVSYSGGGVLVTYGARSRAVRVTFVVDVDGLEMQLDQAEVLASYYRPPDAQLQSQEVVEPGFIRRIYTSPTLTALFAGSDTGDRDSDRYVEELRFDPATQRARAIDMALGERP